MVVMNVDYFDVNIHLVIRKDYWITEHKNITEELIADKIQSGIEIPIEQTEIIINK